MCVWLLVGGSLLHTQAEAVGPSDCQRSDGASLRTLTSVLSGTDAGWCGGRPPTSPGHTPSTLLLCLLLGEAGRWNPVAVSFLVPALLLVAATVFQL